MKSGGGGAGGGGGGGSEAKKSPAASSNQKALNNNSTTNNFKKSGGGGGLSSRLSTAVKYAEDLQSNLPLAEQSRRNLNSPPVKIGNAANSVLLERAKSAGNKKKGGGKGDGDDSD